MRIVSTVIFLSLLLSTPALPKPGQKTPDTRRQTQIREALKQHGFEPGRTWNETTAVLKQIAHQHYWQTNHVPDARVLILLGLGNKYSDPDVLTTPPSRLEPGVQSEYVADKKRGKP